MELNFENVLKYLEELGVGGKLRITSMQRRFMSGYIKTAKMVDELEEQGFLSEVNFDTKSRKVLKTK